jgi:hypothetical protein
MPISYLDFFNLTGTSSVAWANMPIKKLIDTTDIGTNDKKQTWAITFRVGDDWLANPANDYTPAFNYYHEFSQLGQQTYQNIGAHQRNNKIGFGYTFDYFTGLEITAKDFKPYRNRWLALVSATSDNFTDFKNWKSARALNTHQYCVRNLLVDIESGTIIGKFDTHAYNIKNKIDLTQTWYAADNLDKTVNDYHDRRFLFLGGNGHCTQAENQLQILSSWVAIGSCLDPDKYWSQISGINLPETVDGHRAWSTLEFNGDILNQILENNGLTTKTQCIKSNSRWPDTFLSYKTS